MSQYLGDISAYALAVSQGYTGTEEEYAELMASYATVGQTAVTAAQTATTKASEAATSATTATNKASEATTAATTATNKAAEAQADADAAALDASQAMSAASTATTKATEATTAAATATSAATTATSAKDDAVSAKTAAQTAQTGAETAAASVEASAAQIQTNADDISELKEDFASIVNTHQNLLEVTAYYDGEYWKRSNPLDRSSSSTYKAFYGIDVEANKTYYYKHIFLYYSVVVYEGTTTVVTLTNDTAQDVSGTFTPTSNGKIYLTYNKTLATPLFTDDEDLYNAGSVDTYYTPNKLKVSAPTDTDDLITAVGYIDGKYVDGSGNPADNAQYRISEFIPVESDAIYDIAFTGQMMVATYKSDKTFIARQILNSGETLTISKIHIPSTAKYVRLSWAITTQPYTKFAKRIDGAEFHVGANYPYLKLSDAVNDAILSLDNVVRIHDGTYDLYTELGGSDYFDSYTYTNDGEGLVLKNRIHLIGSSASLITFNYAGSNAQVKQYFSVFNAGVEGFVLENVNIECSNCRYAVHDERYTNIDLYVNKYLNCSMAIDNSANSYGYRQCIGGGLGVNGEVIIKDCYFKTVGESVSECVSYHNSSSSSAKNRIVVCGNYCDNGTMRFSWHGTSTKITEVIASNNSVPSAITTRAEQTGDTAENIVLRAWNNEIRSA